MRISSVEYRDFARQCLRWAARTTREDHKNIMLQMANHWLEVAQDIEDSAGQRELPKGRARNRIKTSRLDGTEHSSDGVVPASPL